jgi:hypothetical protein
MSSEAIAVLCLIFLITELMVALHYSLRCAARDEQIQKSPFEWEVGSSEAEETEDNSGCPVQDSRCLVDE